MEGRHVGLDFYDLLIEVLWRCDANHLDTGASLPPKWKSLEELEFAGV